MRKVATHQQGDFWRMTEPKTAHLHERAEPNYHLGSFAAICGMLVLAGCVSEDLSTPIRTPVQNVIPMAVLEELQVDEAYLRTLNDKVRAGVITETDKEKLWQVYKVRLASRVVAERRAVSSVSSHLLVAPSF